MDDLQTFQYLTKYARWNYAQGRREQWPETTARYIAQLKRIGGDALTAHEYQEMHVALLNLQAIGSMRTLAMAGGAFERDNLTGYNCAALEMRNLEAFHDLSIMGMAGAGVTYSVEQRHVAQLPVVRPESYAVVYHTVADSAEGWAATFLACIQAAYAGHKFAYDLRGVRAKGALLKTKGGRASGPEPLRKALDNIYQLIRRAVGRKLTSLEVSDVCCFIGDAVVSGGVRRTALMALFDEDDMAMTNAKSGDWFAENPQRSNANFSRAINAPAASRAEMAARIAPMLSPSGEPGIFQRFAALARMSPQRRERLTAAQLQNLKVNPCGEAILTESLCNLSAFVARPADSLTALKHYARMAARMGTLQAAATNFPNLLNPAFKANCETERLLGVGFLGYADNAALRNPQHLYQLRRVIQAENVDIAARLGIAPASACTAVKPAGNSGVFIGASSGIHPWHYPYMLRRITLDDHDPMYMFLRDSGAPLEPSSYKDGQHFLLYPIAAPKHALTMQDVTALDQLRALTEVTNAYTDHAVSVTIHWHDGEQDAIIDYLYAHQHEIMGATFYRHDGASYAQPIISQISADEYARQAAAFPVLQWERLAEYEQEDFTAASGEIACGGGQCDLGSSAPLAGGFQL